MNNCSGSQLTLTITHYEKTLLFSVYMSVRPSGVVFELSNFYIQRSQQDGQHTISRPFLALQFQRAAYPNIGFLVRIKCVQQNRQ